MAKIKILLHGKLTSELDLVQQASYTAGRSDGCEILLKNLTGISRQHFKLSFISDHWQVSTISKFSKIILDGEEVDNIILEEGKSFSVPPYDFYFTEATSPILEEKKEPLNITQSKEEMSLVPSSGMHPTEIPGHQRGFPSIPSSNNDFDGNEEATMVKSVNEGIPYLRFFNNRQVETKVMRLEGNMWIAGRDSNCQIIIEDMKVSRRQFELQLINGNFMIRDLGSSNGTLLNGSAIPSDEPVMIKSGDIITILHNSIHFEIRDPNFNEKINRIQPEILATSPVVYNSDSPNYNSIILHENYNQSLSQYSTPNFPEQPREDHRNWFQKLDRAKKIRFALIGIIVIVFAFALLPSSNKTTKDKPKSAKEEPFLKLTQEKQTFVKQTYLLAMDYYRLGKYELALSEIQKIHEMIPYYEDSKEILEHCRQGIETLNLQQEEDRKRRQQEEIAAQVSSTIAQCREKMNKMQNTAEMENCLLRARELDPENSEIHALILQISNLEAERNRLSAERKDYQARLSKSRNLFAQAEEQKSKGQYLKANATYNKFINSGLPDPDNNKDKARKSIAEIQAIINSKALAAIDEYQKLQEAGNFRPAIEVLLKARALDPTNELLNEKIDAAKTELSSRMRSLYQEGILEESIGKIPEAKEKWKMIIEKDIPDGDFYKKAKSKLKLYGG